jgi:[acyl-carrier-protein] S-malonyltransferase
MGMDLYEKYSSAKMVYDYCGDVVKSLSFDSGHEGGLDQTVNAQPCLFAADLAAALSLNEHGLLADGAAGFSLGETPALAYCGILSIDTTFKLVNFRANAMQECVQKNPGGMMAVMNMEAEDVIKLCDEVEGTYPANFNAPGQIVVSHREDAMTPLMNAVKDAGGRAVPLAVSGPFHCPLMDEAHQQLEQYLEPITFNQSLIPLYANVTGLPYDKENAKQLLATQVNHSVLWQATIENMVADGFDTFIETGPGKTLRGLIRRINKDVRTFSVYDSASLEDTVAKLL